MDIFSILCYTKHSEVCQGENRDKLHRKLLFFSVSNGYNSRTKFSHLKHLTMDFNDMFYNTEINLTLSRKTYLMTKYNHKWSDQYATNFSKR